MYVPERLRQGIIGSEPDCTIAGHFGRDRTLELATRNFDYIAREQDIQNSCNASDITPSTSNPTHVRHGILHPLELACKPRTYISTD